MNATTALPALSAPGQPAGRAGSRTPNGLWEGFAATAERFPGRIAVTSGNESISYRDLAAQADAVHAGLGPLSPQPDATVAILCERTPAMIAAMLGVVRSGAAYLPIDPRTPAIRVQEILDDARPVAVLADRPLRAILGDAPCPVLLVEDLLTAPAKTAVPPHASLPESLAYVLYTSGSTGKPKGVMVTQQNVTRLFRSTEPWFHFDEHDVWTVFHSFAFDFSVWEIWGPLLTGGRMVIVPFAVSRSPEEFYDLLAAEQVTVLNQTPTAFTQLIYAEERAAAQGIARPLALRTVIFGGEALNLRALAPWVRRHGDARPELINMYGITETTVHVTYRRVREQDIAHETDSLIGVPIPDLTLHLVDESLALVPDGKSGEIVVGGAGVARGYLHRPKLTAERFVPSPYQPDETLYRSGDLAFRRADGELVYLGRADRQVKINGFRIELGEIEAVLAECPLIVEACALPFEHEGHTQLAACVVASRNGGHDEIALRSFVESRLPAHMRPARYAWLPALPLNQNGKVDREALLTALREPTQPVLRQAAATPRSAMQATVLDAWARVLPGVAIQLDQNFFDAGASSLKLAAWRTELERALSRSVPMTRLFEHTTPRSLAAWLESDAASQTATHPANGLPAQNPAQDRARQQREALARLRHTRAAAQEASR